MLPEVLLLIAVLVQFGLLRLDIYDTGGIWNLRPNVLDDLLRV